MTLHTFIEHTNLQVTATPSAISKLCQEAKEYQFHGVCVHGCYVSLAQKELQGSDVKIVSVIGFPLGAMSSAAKMEEAKQNLSDGADEIDMVLNLGWLKGQCFEKVENDIAAVKMVVSDHPLKVILETCYLTDTEKVKACELAQQAGADFVKTSTGFGTGGATLADVQLLKTTVGDNMGIKASGGIKTHQQAERFIQAGASRIGTSSGIDLLRP